MSWLSYKSKYPRPSPIWQSEEGTLKSKRVKGSEKGTTPPYHPSSHTLYLPVSWLIWRSRSTRPVRSMPIHSGIWPSRGGGGMGGDREVEVRFGLVVARGDGGVHTER